MIGKFGKAFDLTKKGLPTQWAPQKNSTIQMWWKPEIDLLRGDYHIFGNDRFRLARNQNKIAMDGIDISSNEGLTFWNKLGSDAEALSSEVGHGLVKLGTPTYATGYFGQGLKGVANAGWEWDPSAVWSSNVRGTIELWVKPNSNFISQTDFAMYATRNDPATGNTAMTFGKFSNQIYWQFYMNGANITTYNPDAFTYVAETWYHFGMCWDLSGIDGTSDRIRVYRDGVDIWSSATTWTETTHPDTSTYQHRFGNGNSGGSAAAQYMRGVIDNVKCWDYAKTDFSDRFFEVSTDLDVGISVPTEKKWYHIGCRINEDRTFDLFQDGEKVYASPNKIPEGVFDDLEEKFWPDHWWQLNEVSGSVVYDNGRGVVSDGTNIGSVSVNQAGRRGSCYTFSNGKYIDCGTVVGDRLGNGVTKIAVSLWAKADAGANGGAFGIGSFTGNAGKIVLLIIGSTVYYYLDAGLSNVNSTFSNPTEWHHWVMTYDGATAALYMDGLLLASGAYSTPVDFLGMKTTIGSYYQPGSSYEFDGKIDDIRLYSKSLSDDDVKQLYDYTKTYHLEQPKISIGEPTSGRLSTPQNWLPLNNRAGVPHDKGSLTSIPTVGGDVPVNQAGPAGSRACKLGNQNAYINIPGNQHVKMDGNSFTIAFWVNFYDLLGGDGNGYNMLVFCRHGDTTDQTLLIRYHNGSNNWGLAFYSDDLWAPNEPSFRPKVGVWQHMTFTYDTSTNKQSIYSDGQLIAYRTAGGDLAGTDDNTLTIGPNDASPSQEPTAYMADFRTYDFAATVEEVRQLHSLGRTPNAEVSDVRYDRVALPDEVIKRSYEANRPVDPDQDAADEHEPEVEIVETEVEQEVDNSAPLHQWKLEEPYCGLVLWNKLEDLTGNSIVGKDITIIGSPVPESAKFNNGLKMLTAANYFDIANTAAVQQNEDAWTYEFWHKYTDLSVTAGIPSAGYPHLLNMRQSNSPVYEVALAHANVGGRFLYYKSAQETYTAHVDLTINIAQNELVHWAVVHDANGIDGTNDGLRLYMNGILIFSRPTPMTFPLQAGDAQIIRAGRIAGQSADWNPYGAMDNLKIWNYAKTDFLDRETEDTPQSQWSQPIDIGSEEIHGVNAGALPGVLLERGKCYYFDGSSSVAIPDAVAAGNEITVSFWAFNEDAGGVVRTPINDDTGGIRRLSVYLPHSNGQMYFDMGDAAGGPEVGYNRINMTYPTSANNKWTHWAFTKNVITGIMKIYMDGIEQLSGTGKTKPIIATPGLILGDITSGGGAYLGKLKDVRIYDRELTVVEINDVYAPSTELITQRASAIVHPFDWGTYFKPDHWWRLQGLSGGVVDSGSKAGAEGAIVNSPVRGVAGKTGKCFDFETGTQDRVNVPMNHDFNFGGGDFAMSLWMKKETADVVIMATGSANVPYSGWAWQSWTSGFTFNYAVGGSWTNKDGGAAIPTGVWTQVVVTRIGNTLYMYRDGVEAVSFDFSDIIIDDSNSSYFKISGYIDGASYWFDGLLDDIRMWKGRGLSAEEVKALYDYTNNYRNEE